MTPRVLNAGALRLKPNAVPPGAVYIGRKTRNGWQARRWGNPFRAGKDAEVIEIYRAWLCDPARPDGGAG